MNEKAKLLADLARAKALFQQRDILAVIGVEPPAVDRELPASPAHIDAQRAHDARRGA